MERIKTTVAKAEETGLVVPGDLQGLFKVDPVKIRGEPELRFYHPSAANAKELVAACKHKGPVVVGMPYMQSDFNYYRLDQVGFFILGEPLEFWALHFNDSEQGIGVKSAVPTSISKQGQKDENGNYWTKGVIALVLVVPFDGVPLDDDLAPACLMVADMPKNTKSKGLLNHFKKTQAATDPKRAAALGEIVGKAPPALRLVSTFTSKSATVAGNPYAKQDCATVAVTEEQLHAVQDWTLDENLQEERLRVEEVFQARCARITELFTKS